LALDPLDPLAAMADLEPIATEPMDVSQPVLYKYTDSVCDRERGQILAAAPYILGRTGAGLAIEQDRRVARLLQRAGEFMQDLDCIDPDTGEERFVCDSPEPPRLDGKEPDLSARIDNLRRLIESHIGHLTGW